MIGLSAFRQMFLSRAKALGYNQSGAPNTNVSFPIITADVDPDGTKVVHTKMVTCGGALPTDRSMSLWYNPVTNKCYRFDEAGVQAECGSSSELFETQ